MTIKIKAPRAYYYPLHEQANVAPKGGTHRIVRESDWRKLMKLVKAVDDYCNSTGDVCDVCEALEALEKKK